MEKSVDTAALPIFSAIRETFDIRKGDIRTYSPLTLAYIGDGIYDLVIRVQAWPECEISDYGEKCKYE